MLDYSFLTNVDRFHFQCGKVPILITGDHAFSNDTNEISSFAPYPSNKETNWNSHPSDFAVPPILETFRKQENYFILENLVQRAVIDMNRPEARLNDQEPHNDYFYRQMIRYILQYIIFNAETLPFLLDLHSFPADSDYAEGNTEILLLIQPTTNAKLVRFTVKFFEEKKWHIKTRPASNVNDVVLEIAQLNLGLPLLMEINEQNLTEPKFSQLISDLNEYLMKVLSLLKSFPKPSIQVSTDAEKSLTFQDHDAVKSTLDFAKFHEYSTINPALRHELQKYLYLTSRYLATCNPTPTIFRHSDSAQASLRDYIDSIEEFIPYESSEMMLDVIYTTAEALQTIIVPLELVELSIRIFLSSINRRDFEEWGFNDNFFTELFSALEMTYPMRAVFLPNFKKNPFLSDQITSIFATYNIKKKYYHSVILGDIQIPKKKLEADLETINQMCRLKGNKSITLQQFEKKGPAIFEFLLKHAL